MITGCDIGFSVSFLKFNGAAVNYYNNNEFVKSDTQGSHALLMSLS